MVEEVINYFNITTQEMMRGFCKDYITPNECYEHCVNIILNNDYAFVWLFIVAFMFSELAIRFPTWKWFTLDMQIRLRIEIGRASCRERV